MILLNPTKRKGPGMAQDAVFHYLPVNEETMGWGLYLTGAGCATIRPGEPYPPGGHPSLYQFDWFRGRTLPEFQLLLLTEGAGEFESEASGRLTFEGEAFIFVFPGVWHRYRPLPDAGWTERWLSFNGALLHRLFDSSSFGPQLAVGTPRDVQRLVEQFDELLEAIDEYSWKQPALLTFQALAIISDAVAQRMQDAAQAGTLSSEVTRYANVHDAVVERALEIIWTQSSCPMSVGDIARQLPVTRRTLDRRFVEATGHSVLEEINTCRLTRAKRLLVETDLPVKTVAHLAGFSSTERMRVAFVDRVGASPSEYRKQAGGTRSEVPPGATLRRRASSRPSNP